jgi:isocitrate dehydrogenase
MVEKRRISVAYGDGIGPEIMEAVITILEAAQAPLEYDRIEIGERAFLRGIESGIPQEAWDKIRANRVLLKAPITTPQGGGYKSVNVTLRKSLGLFANVRPCKAYMPFVESDFPKMDMIIIRENEEDLYGGIEHRQTCEVTQVLKLISQPGSENIIRYAFEYARAYGRKKVTCMTKDNIMKITDGLFHRVFNEVAAEYPDVKAEHQIIDIGTANVAARPESLDVIVTLNLYGDILSDVAAQVAGSVGLAGSSNIGRESAMFEAVHGSAPDIAGRGIANPSGLLQAAVQMLVHLGMAEQAEAVQNAWLCTLEDGIHTGDIYRPGLSKQKAGTQEFARAVVERLGRAPAQLLPERYRGPGIQVVRTLAHEYHKELVGVDIFLDWESDERRPEVLGPKVEGASRDPLRLQMVANGGVKVYPEGVAETYLTDHWRCRFLAQGGKLSYGEILALLGRLDAAGLQVIKTENLYTFDGKPGFSSGAAE